MTCALTPPHVQSAQQALVSALRREGTAAKQVYHLQSELAALQDLLTANQRELQRNQMVMKFRTAEVERRRVCPHEQLHHCRRTGCCDCQESYGSWVGGSRLPRSLGYSAGVG